MKLAITFPHPDRALSPNSSVPLTTKAAVVCNRKRVALKGATRQAAFVQALNATMQFPQRNFPARSYEVRWMYKGRIPDVDNIVARLKPLIDGCCQAFGIDDRELELGRVRRIHTLGADAGHVEIVFSTDILD
jgi:hypothetical protein